MILNDYGQIANNEWMRNQEIRNYIELDAYIIMPNHMHAILFFKSKGDLPTKSECDPRTGESHSPSTSSRETPTIKSPSSLGEFDSPQPTGEFDSPLRGPSNTVGAVVRGYKSAVTKQCNLLHIGRQVWQRDYYEHIIRDERAYINISKYIYNNPMKWWEDKFYK